MLFLLPAELEEGIEPIHKLFAGLTIGEVHHQSATLGIGLVLGEDDVVFSQFGFDIVIVLAVVKDRMACGDHRTLKPKVLWVQRMDIAVGKLFWSFVHNLEYTGGL